MLTISILAEMVLHITMRTLVHAILLPRMMDFMLPGEIDQYTQTAAALGKHRVHPLPRVANADEALAVC